LLRLSRVDCEEDNALVDRAPCAGVVEAVLAVPCDERTIGSFIAQRWYLKKPQLFIRVSFEGTKAVLQFFARDWTVRYDHYRFASRQLKHISVALPNVAYSAGKRRQD